MTSPNHEVVAFRHIATVPSGRELGADRMPRKRRVSELRDDAEQGYPSLRAFCNARSNAFKVFSLT